MKKKNFFDKKRNEKPKYENKKRKEIYCGRSR
jgi:hypothetical protein